jgi:hypothetical protein
MRKANENFSGKAILAGVLITVLLLPGISSAAKAKPGRQMILTLKDGRVVEGELLSVVDDRLILYDNRNAADTDIRIKDVSKIKIHKGHLTLGGLALGALAGVVAGVTIKSSSENSRHESSGGWGSAVADAISSKIVSLTVIPASILLGTLFGGLVGSSIRNVESINLAKRPFADTAQILSRLSSKARNKTHIQASNKSELIYPEDAPHLSAVVFPENISAAFKAPEPDQSSIVTKLIAGFSLGRDIRRLY